PIGNSQITVCIMHSNYTVVRVGQSECPPARDYGEFNIIIRHIQFVDSNNVIHTDTWIQYKISLDRLYFHFIEISKLSMFERLDVLKVDWLFSLPGHRKNGYRKMNKIIQTISHRMEISLTCIHSGQLALNQVVIHPLALQQLSVGPFLHHYAVLYDKNSRS